MRIRSLLLIAVISVVPFSIMAEFKSSTLSGEHTTMNQQPIANVRNSDEINYIQTSQQAQLIMQSDGSYKMLMSGINHRVLWFTNQSEHSAGVWALSAFIEKWGQNRADHLVDGAHGILTANTKTDGSGQNVMKALLLSKPVYNTANDTLTYDVKVIFDVNHNMANQHLYHASLFIGSHRSA